MRAAEMLVWMGDFNYRINCGYEDAKENIRRGRLETLLERVRHCPRAQHLCDIHTRHRQEHLRQINFGRTKILFLLSEISAARPATPCQAVVKRNRTPSAVSLYCTSLSIVSPHTSAGGCRTS